MIIRVRTNVGQWRIDSESLSLLSTGKDLLDEIAVSRPSVEYTQPLSFDPAGKRLLDLNQTLQQLNIQHGAMIYCLVDPTTVKAISNPNQTDNTNNNTNTTNAAEDAQPADPKHMKRVILPDGSISLVHDPDFLTKDKSFRKGMLPLKSMKMQWTLQEFVAMDDQFVFKITRQQERWVGDGGVSLDQDSANAFQAYLRNFAFQRQRFGYLYGKFIDEKETEEEKRNRPKKEVLFGTELPGTEFTHVAKNQKVIVEAIYEPPQEYDPDAAEGFIALDDPNEEKIEALANMLGLKRVGWIFGHPPREKGFQMASSEIIMAAELQIEAAQGVDETPFVTVKVTAGDDGNVSFEAFQVSKQCMEMVAEEALMVGENPGFCYVNETFSAIQEGKNSNMIENNFFLTVVPIVQHSSEMFVSDFPKANRDHDSRQQTHDEMKKQLQKSGSAGWTFVDLLADFNMLIYLTKFLDLETDIPKICRSIVDRDIPLEEGYKLIIASMAGLDGAY